jgi:hypothetical protein
MIQTYDKKIVAVGWLYTIVTLGGQPTMQPFAVKFDLNAPSSAIWKINGFGIYGLTNGFTGIVEQPNHELLISGILDTIDGNADRPNNQLPGNIFIRFTKVDQNSGLVKANKLYNYKNTDSTVQYYQGMRSFHLCQDGGWVGAIDLMNYGVNPFMFVRYDSTGCDTTQQYCQALWTTGIKALSSSGKSFSLFPNPTQGKLFFDSRTVIGDEIKIFEFTGKLVLKQQIDSGAESYFVDLSGLQNGMYFFSIESDNKSTYRTKIYKEN